MKKKRRTMTDEQARAYIQGEEPYDEAKRRYEHVESLCRTADEMIERCKANSCAFIDNAIFTVSHYIELPWNAEQPNIGKLIQKLEVLKQMKRQKESAEEDA